MSSPPPRPARRRGRPARPLTAVHLRRPRIDDESHAVGLDRNEAGALLVAAGLGIADEHALVSLLALDGLRVSEATGADIEALGTERGHRTWQSPARTTRRPSSRSPQDRPGRYISDPAIYS